jgi:hypothetical protein
MIDEKPARRGWRTAKNTVCVGDRAGIAEHTGTSAYQSKEDFSEAIEYRMQHFEILIAQEVGDRAREGRAYGNLERFAGRLFQDDRLPPV